MNVVEVLKQLIRFPSYQVSVDRIADGMKECASFLSQSLEGLGFKVEVDELFTSPQRETLMEKKRFC